MKSILSERKLVIVLFVLVLITFSLAQEDSRKMEKMNPGAYTGTSEFQSPSPQFSENTTVEKNTETLPAR